MAAAVEAKYGGVHVALGRPEQVEGGDLGTMTSVLPFSTVEQARAF